MRFSEGDYNKIKVKAQKARLDMTKYITTSALDEKIIIVDGLDEMIKSLKGIGRNMNQLTTLCNMGKIQCLDLKEIKSDFNMVFEQLQRLIKGG